MRKGFTLIELLVVVLIIGILASVALPQYNKAVRKARVSEARTNLKTISDAVELFFLENPSESSVELDTLDISVPLETKNWTYYRDECIDRGCIIIATPKFETDNYDIEYAPFAYDSGHSNLSGKFVCWYEDAAGKSICKTLGKADPIDSRIQLD